MSYSCFFWFNDKKQSLCKGRKVQFIWLLQHFQDYGERLWAFNFLIIAVSLSEESIKVLSHEVKSWCVDSLQEDDNGIWAQRRENEKYQDKYSSFAITHLIRNLQFWSCRWICGLNESKVPNKVSLHVEDPSAKNLIIETFLFREVVSYPKDVNYMFLLVMIRLSVGVKA